MFRINVSNWFYVFLFYSYWSVFTPWVGTLQFLWVFPPAGSGIILATEMENNIRVHGVFSNCCRQGKSHSRATRYCYMCNCVSIVHSLHTIRILAYHVSTCLNVGVNFFAYSYVCTEWVPIYVRYKSFIVCQNHSTSMSSTVKKKPAGREGRGAEWLT